MYVYDYSTKITIDDVTVNVCIILYYMLILKCRFTANFKTMCISPTF